MPQPIRYPYIKVKLSGEDGNSYAILARVRQALREGGVPKEQVKEYFDEATKGDYNHLLQVTLEWVEVE